MDLETENRIAAILMKEAAELRREAARDGIDAYLRPPNVRGRPNSRFLTATVLGVQQSYLFNSGIITDPSAPNRAVEVNEMWRARQKEKELDDTVKKDEKKRGRSYEFSDSHKYRSTRFEDYKRKRSSICSSSKNAASEDVLGDNEIEEFLHSRAKRGRGAIGSRMDETGPYLPDSKGKHLESPNDIGYRESWDNCAILGPEKPRNMTSISSSDEESAGEMEKRAKRVSSSKHHCRKHRSNEKSEDKKKKKKKRKKKEKKRSKHHK